MAARKEGSMKLSSWILAGTLVAAASFSAGCGDDSSPADDGGTDDARDVPADEGGADADADGDADGDGDGGTGTLSVLVVSSAWPSDTETPVAGATVALDAPGGGRSELTTDATGHVNFTGLDWSAGTAAVTACNADMGLASRVGVVEADGEVKLEVFAMEYPPADFVEITGNSLNMISEANDLGVTATVPSESLSDTGPAWTMHIQPGVAFTLVGLESHQLEPPVSHRGIKQFFDQWTVVEHAAVTAATAIDLDFDSTATPTPTTVTGSFTGPTRSDSPLRNSGTGYFYVTSRGSQFTVTLGWPSTIDVNVDWTGYNYDGEYVQVPGVTDPMTVYIIATSNGVRSTAIVEGWPTDGAHDLGFIDLPTVTAPASFSTTHPMHSPIEWTAYDTDLECSVSVLRDGTSVWSIRGPTDATSITIPAAPSTVDLPTLLGTGVVESRLNLFRRDATDTYSERSIRTPIIILDPAA
jgi:hypothetical protein